MNIHRCKNTWLCLAFLEVFKLGKVNKGLVWDFEKRVKLLKYLGINTKQTCIFLRLGDLFLNFWHWWKLTKTRKDFFSWISKNEQNFLELLERIIVAPKITENKPAYFQKHLIVSYAFLEVLTLKIKKDLFLDFQKYAKLLK